MGAPDFTTRDQVAEVYARRAKHYDIAANAYYLLGFREFAYRRRTIDELALSPGDTVVEIGCGTGLNFAYLEDRVGAEGRIIGVDLSPEMLAQARKRVAANGWRNVELVECAAADYRFPERVDGVFSFCALTLEPEYDRVIAAGAAALAPGGRWVLFDIKLPDNWLRHLAPVLVWLERPFAVSLELARRHPWESLARHLPRFRMREYFLGIAYIAVGEKPPV